MIGGFHQGSLRLSMRSHLVAIHFKTSRECDQDINFVIDDQDAQRRNCCLIINHIFSDAYSIGL